MGRGSELLALAHRLENRAVPPRLAHSLEWGVVDSDGMPRVLPPCGAELVVGDRIFLAVENTSPWAFRLSMFDVGVGLAVTLLNPNEPEGIDLGSGETTLLGAPEWRRMIGLELQWPQDTPSDEPREESLVVFISRDCLPLTSWATSSWSDAPQTRGPSPQPRMTDVNAYIVRRVTFRLHPRKDTT